MITLHDVRTKGSEAVKAAVLAFGARHPLNSAVRDAGTDWNQAEQHFTHLIAAIMGAVPPQDSAAATVYGAENEAIHFLLAVSDLPDYRCPVCVRRQTPRCRPPARAGGVMTDCERAEHAARLRGLLYLACPDAPARAVESTAEAIAQYAETAPREGVPEAAGLGRPRQQPSGADWLNLSGADLTGADLTGANLSNADLYRADLYGADLTGANLTGANLTGADQRHANLSRADLTDVNLSHANLRRADLTGTLLYGAYMTDADLYGALLYRADLTGADLTDALLHGADLTDAILADADLTDTDLTDADLTGADLSGAVLAGATDMRLPAGAVWNRETLWPADLASEVAEHSDEVSPGVYQVGGGPMSRRIEPWPVALICAPTLRDEGRDRFE